MAQSNEIEVVHKRIDKLGGEVDRIRDNQSHHEKECAERHGVIVTKLGGLEKAFWAVVGVLTALEIGSIVYIATGQWPG